MLAFNRKYIAYVEYWATPVVVCFFFVYVYFSQTHTLDKLGWNEICGARDIEHFFCQAHSKAQIQAFIFILLVPHRYFCIE